MCSSDLLDQLIMVARSLSSRYTRSKVRKACLLYTSFARFLRDRLGRENVIFTSGTDCYGSPIMESYRKLKENEGYDKSINEYVESNHSRQAATLNNYNILSLIHI